VAVTLVAAAIKGCALVPALSYVQYMLMNRGLLDPISANANVAAYQAAIQGQEPAVRVLAEFRRGREERREQIASGELEKIRVANQAAREAAERATSARPRSAYGAGQPCGD